MHALVRFAHIAAGSTLTTAEIHPAVIEALGWTSERYSLASLRYDLSKLRAKGLVAKVPNSRRYQLLRHGYSICLVFLKLFERVYAPPSQPHQSRCPPSISKTISARPPLSARHRRPRHPRASRRTKSRVSPTLNENKIHVTASITV